MLNFRSPSNNVQIIKISGLEGAQGSLERQHRSVTKVTLRGEGGGAREPVTSVTTGTRNIGAKRRANSFAAVTTSTSVSLIRAPSIEKRLEDTERSRASQFCKFKRSKVRQNLEERPIIYHISSSLLQRSSYSYSTFSDLRK